MSSQQKDLELGREKMSQGDYLGALTHIDAVLALDSTSFEALQLRSRALYLLGRDAEALQTLRQAHNALRAHLPEAEISLTELDVLDECDLAGEIVGADALETLLALRERYRLDADLLALLAELSEDAGRYEIAREAYEELVANEPNRLDAWEGLVHVLSHEDLDAALSATTRALQLYPTHALFYEFLGFIHYRRRQYRQAIIAYRQAIEHGDDRPDNYQALAYCYLALGDTAAALEMTHLLSSRWGEEAAIHRFAVEVALQCEAHEVAIAHTHQLVRLHPSHAETYCYKAWVELRAVGWDDAERTLRLGFHKAVDGAFTLFELVELLLVADAPHEALRVAELAFELAPDHPESSAARGKALRELDAFPEALDAFRQAAILAPQDDAYQTWIGIVHDNLGEHHEAIRQFNHVLSRHPSDVWTLANRGLTYLAIGMIDHAVADFSRSIDIDPHDAQIFFWRASALVKRGDHDSALRDLRRSLDLSDETQVWL